MSLVDEVQEVGLEEVAELPPNPPSSKTIQDKFYTAAINTGEEEDPQVVYDQLDGELGEAIIADTKKTIGEYEATQNKDYLLSQAIRPEVDVESLERQTLAVAELNTKPVDLALFTAKELAATDLSLTRTERDRDTARSDWVAKRNSELYTRAHLMQQEVWDFEENTGVVSFISDFFGTILPFNEMKSVIAMSQAIGLETEPVDYILYGNKKKEIINKLGALEGVELEEAKLKAELALQQHSGFLGENHFLTYMLTEQLLKNPDKESWLHAVDNIIGMIDVIPLAGLAGKSVKGVGKKLFGTPEHASTSIRGEHVIQDGSPVKVVNSANPRAGEETAAKIVSDDSGKAAAQAGTDRAAVINDTIMPNPALPNTKIKAYEGMPAKVLEKVEKIRKHVTDAVHRATPDLTTLFTKAEIKSAGAKLTGELETFFNTVTNTATSSVHVTEDSIKLKATMQADDYGGWDNLQHLFDDMTAKFDNPSFEDLRIFHREVDSDDYVDVTDQLDDIVNRWKAGDTGDFTYTLDVDIPITPEWKAALGDDAVQAGMGSFTKYLRGNAGFSDWIRHTAFGSVDRVGALNKDLQTALEKGFKGVGGKTINPLKARKRFRGVIEAIQQGAREEKWYTPKELLHQFKFTDEQMGAYYSFREVSDALYTVTNADLYKTLNREGWNSLTFPTGVANKDLGIFGRGLSLEEVALEDGFKTFRDGSTTMALNPVTGRQIAVGSIEKVQRLYSQGKRIAIVRGGEGGKRGVYSHDGVRHYEYLIVDEARGAKVERLTSFPLKYREGHYYRSYKDENYIVQFKHPDATINGVSKEVSGFEPKYKSIGVAKNKKDALRLLNKEAERTGLNPEEAYKVIPAKHWHEGRMQSEADWELIEAAALSSQKSRGNHLRGVEDLEAAIENPIDAIGRTISAVSSRIGKRDWYEANQAAWTKTYGEFFHGFPTSRDALVKNIDSIASSSVGKKRMGKEALAYYDYINMVKGTGTPMSDTWRSWVFLTMSETDIDLLQVMAPYAAGTVKVLDPALRLKQSAFLFYLAWNPIKQLILQPTQLLQMTALYPKYMATKFVPELSALAAEALGKKGGKLGEQLLKELDATGITKNIDHHQWVNQGQSSRLMTGDHLKPFSIRANLSKAGRMPSKLGFEAGETANQVGHWLIVRSEYLKNNPNANMLDKKHIDGVMGLMRDMSGGMTSAGKFGYQGWGTQLGEAMSVAMQFASHSHKMLLMMLPQKAGGVRFLTPKQKAKLAFTNTALAGAGLFPFMNDIIDQMQNESGVEFHPEVDHALRRGLMDLSMNKLIGIAAGEEVDVRFDKAFTGTGAIESFSKNIYESLAHDPMHQWDFAAGVAAFGQIANTISAIGTIWKDPEEIFDTDEKIGMVVSRLAELSSGVSNYRKAQMAINTGHITSKSGNAIDEINLTESVIKMFGMPLGVEQSYYDLIDMAKAFRRENQDMKEDVRQIYKNVEVMFKGTDMSSIEKMIYANGIIAVSYVNMNERVQAYDELAKIAERDILDGVDSISSQVMREAYDSGNLDRFKNFLRQHPKATPANKVIIESLFGEQ